MTMKAISTEKATLISTTSGMPLRPGRGEDEAVLQGHEAHHQADGVAAGDHHQQSEQDDGEGEGQVLARQRVGGLGDPQHHHQRQAPRAPTPASMVRPVHHLVDLAVDAEAHDDLVQREGMISALNRARSRR